MKGDERPRRSRLSSTTGPRVAQMVPPVLRPAGAKPPQRPARAAPPAARRAEAQPVSRPEDLRRASASSASAAASSAAESVQRPSLAVDEADCGAGALQGNASTSPAPIMTDGRSMASSLSVSRRTLCPGGTPERNHAQGCRAKLNGALGGLQLRHRAEVNCGVPPVVAYMCWHRDVAK